MDNWEKVKISSFADVVGGGTPSRKKEDIYFGGNIPWLSPRDLSDHNSRFVKRGAENITKEGLNNSSAKLLPKNAILFSSRATIGNVAIAKNPITTSQGFRSLVCKNGKANPDFIYYALQYYTSEIEQIASGATYKEISGSALADFEINLPPLETQQKIASILSAFDDLIENNNRRIEILEEMARRIYREWFVHFRYPGHEDDEMVDSGTELGEIPEGWEVKSIDDIIDAMGGGTPRTKVDEYWKEGTINWFTPSDLTSSGRLYMTESERKITEEGLNNSSAKMFPPYSVMMTSRATLGVIAFNTEPASVNQGFIVCIPNEKVSAYQIYFWLQENLQRMINEASGATYKEITKTNFRKMNFPVIEGNLYGKFVKIVEPLFKEIENLEKKNEKLKETRDLILPKLISGKVRFENGCI